MINRKENSKSAQTTSLSHLHNPKHINHTAQCSLIIWFKSSRFVYKTRKGKTTALKGVMLQIQTSSSSNFCINRGERERVIRATSHTNTLGPFSRSSWGKNTRANETDGQFKCVPWFLNRNIWNESYQFKFHTLKQKQMSTNALQDHTNQRY